MRLGPYELEAELGRGGMGVVWRARGPAGPVAVKVVAPSYLADPRALARFHREASGARAVVHANVAQLLDVGEAGGHRYLVFELLTGGSLAGLLRTRGRLPWREAAAIAADVARGLAAIHERGLIHRDLKPANVLLDAEGRAKVADLGLVKNVSGEATGVSVGSLTKTSEFVGTMEFAAPEQLDGAQVGARVDLYALGATLFALVAGEPPFSGAGVVLAKRVVTEEAPRLRSRAPEVPPALDDLVARLLAKEPEDRPASAGDVADALADVLAGGVAARAPARTVALVLVALALVASSALLVTSRPRSGPPLPPPPPPPPPPAAPPPPVARAGPAVPRHYAQARSRRGTLELVHAYGDPRWRPGPRTATFAASFLDRRFAVTAGTDDEVKAWDLATGEQVAALPGTTGLAVRHAVAARTAAGQRFIVTGADGGDVAVIDVQGAEGTPPALSLRKSVSFTRSSIFAVAVGGRGKRAIAIAKPESGVAVAWDDVHGAPTRYRQLAPRFAVPERNAPVAAIDAAGRFAYVVDRRGLLRVDLDAPGEPALVAAGAQAVACASAADVLAYAQRDRIVVRGRTGERALQSSSTVLALALSADGSVVVGSTGDSVRRWDVATGEAGPEIATERPFAIACTPEGDRVLGALGERSPILHADLASGSDLRTECDRTWGPLTGAVALADGSMIAATHGEVVRRWERHGRELSPLAAPDRVQAIAAAPAGDRIAVVQVPELGRRPPRDTIRSWRLREGGPGESVATSFNLTTAVAFLDSTRVVAGRTGGAVTWELGSPEVVAYEPRHPILTGRVTAAGAYVRGTFLLGCANGSIGLSQPDNTIVFLHQAASPIAAIVPLPDRTGVVGVSGHRDILRFSDDQPAGGLLEGKDDVEVAAISPERDLVACVPAKTSRIDLHDLRTGALLDSIELGSRSDAPFTLAFADGGRALLAATWRGVVLELKVKGP